MIYNIPMNVLFNKYDPWAIMKKIQMNETSLHREMLKTENYGLIII